MCRAGVETLNRQRCRALRLAGIEAHCLYYNWGPACRMSRTSPSTSPAMTSRSSTSWIRIILTSSSLRRITPVFRAFECCGFKGKFVLEIQGYGPKSAHAHFAQAVPYVNEYADAPLNPNTRILPLCSGSCIRISCSFISTIVLIVNGSRTILIRDPQAL